MTFPLLNKRLKGLFKSRVVADDAKALELSTDQLQAIVDGQRRPTTEQVVAIAKLLETDARPLLADIVQDDLNGLGYEPPAPPAKSRSKSPAQPAARRVTSSGFQEF